MSDCRVSTIKYAETDEHVLFVCDMTWPGDQPDQRVVLAIGNASEATSLYENAREKWIELVDAPEKVLKEVYTETVEVEVDIKDE